MYDYLADHKEHPQVVLMNCTIHEKKLTAKIGFFAIAIRRHKEFELFDKRGIKICKIKLPLAGYGLPKDIALDLTGEQFEVLEYYV